MSLLYGAIEGFDVKHGDFEEYIERLEHYFKANDVADKKKASILITVVGQETYSILRSVLTPDKPADKSYVELKTTLTKHLKPKRIIIAERYKFYERKQLPNESVNNFVAEIKKLASTCEFGGFFQEAIRDKLVCGMSNSKCRRRLLVEKDLTMEKAIEIANSIEDAELENRRIDSRTSTSLKHEEGIDVLNIKSRKPRCYRCDSESHLANKCNLKDVKCNRCGKIGHIGKVCRTKKRIEAVNNTQYESSESKDPEKEVQNVATAGSDVEEEIYHIHTLVNSNRPYNIMLDINGQQVKFEIDTGSGVTVISEGTYYDHFQENLLQSTNAKINTYTNEPISILGKIYVYIR